jgi:orotidine-5'-phosphate decarboxylase
MQQRDFRHLLEERWRRDCLVCIGLDPDWDMIPSSLKSGRQQERDPGDVLYDFGRGIIDATYERAGTYKLQSSYYERWGATGAIALRRTVEYLDQVAPSVPRILDAKRGDNYRSNRGYVISIFDHLGFDAVTLHPYLGGVETLRPFLDRMHKGCIVLCRNSNPDAPEFQDQQVIFQQHQIEALLRGPAGSMESARLEPYRRDAAYHLPLYLVVALRVANHWNTNGNCGPVVGATYPAEAQEIRRVVGDDLYFLVPGVGSQGGDVEAAVKACRNSRGEELIVSSSSGIIHASQGADFAEWARERAAELNGAIAGYRKQ